MHTRCLALLLLLVTLAMPARAEIVVIVHPDSPIQNLDLRTLSDLYLGRIRQIDGERVLTLDQANNSPLRSRFFALINGMDLLRVNAYWARLQFSGDMQPPPQLHDSQAVIDAVRRNRLAIGYVDTSATPLPSSVRPIFRLQ